jgi:hypothetical protein
MKTVVSHGIADVRPGVAADHVTQAGTISLMYEQVDRRRLGWLEVALEPAA